MLNQSGDVDRLLHALADPTRRRIVEQLGRGPATVSELAAPLPMSLPAVLQHLQVLTASRIVATDKVGRVRTCRLEPDRLGVVADWIAARRQTWERRLNRLGEILAQDDSPATGTRESET
ncbi:MAG: helix-turn-helix transcriptional regulator [Chloroflexi bacterium]|nr:helix-turn-helix transcriptional regulator [Chloroflexota bacterium]